MSRWPVLREETPEYLAGQVSGCSKLLLMADYDGTLVPIRKRPEFALPGPALLRALRRLAGKSRVVLAVISGRDTDDIKKMIPVEGIYLAGCHGAEVLCPGGEKYTAVDKKKLAPVLEVVAGLARNCISGREGFLVEKKRAAVALHFRLADQVAALKVVGDFKAAVQPLAIKHRLEFTAGRKVIEVRPRGVNKGRAVWRLMSLYPTFFPLYFGDDATDEDAFRVVKESGLPVLVSEHRKNTAATSRLRGPHDVLRFIQTVSERFQ
ncbi:MAG: trehalose-phosphatase [Peptococcaceae bacterium]|nr:trehalose-phosphatase [Peptococcaceae bacterium]